MEVLKTFINDNVGINDLVTIKMNGIMLFKDLQPHKIGSFYMYYRVKDISCNISNGITHWIVNIG